MGRPDVKRENTGFGTDADKDKNEYQYFGNEIRAIQPNRQKRRSTYRYAPS